MSNAAKGLAALMHGLPRYSTAPGQYALNTWGKPITKDPLAGVVLEANMTPEQRAAQLASASGTKAEAFNWAAHYATHPKPSASTKKKGGAKRKSHKRRKSHRRN